jgi:hypothetical protein
MRAIVLALCLTAACAPGQTSKNSEGTYKPVLDPAMKKQFQNMTPEQHAENVRKIREFVSALNLFNSPEPAKWDEAFATLRGLGEFEITQGLPNPKNVEEASDRHLIKMAQGLDARAADTARKELGLRAKIIILCWEFEKPYTLVSWDTAKKALFEIGDRAKWMLAYTLLSALVSQRPMEWQYIRFYMAELGSKAFDVIKAYLDTVLLPRVPEGVIGATAGFMFHKDKLEQCLAALLQLGPLGRDYFLELAKSAKPWVRRSIAVSVVIARDVSRFDALQKYALSDPDEDVRAVTFASLGKMSYAIDEAGPILLQAMASEKSEIGLAEIAKAIVELNYRQGVPKMIELLDHPSYPVVRLVMDALEALTHAGRKLGQKLQTPAEWKKYWNEKLKPTWK